jgi:hypothetical protein
MHLINQSKNKGEHKMKVKVSAIILLVSTIVMISALVGAEEKFGVKIYPGAVFDSKTAKAFSSSSGQNAFYTTKDDVAKVFEFYKKQPALKPMGTGLTTDSDGKRSAAFMGDAIMLTIESPHLDVTTAACDKKTGVRGKMLKDTLISIQRY